ncbi:MAG: Glu-tRNA(Gln) amidotransferase subunit GatE [Bacteroidales bacterium]|nr:Glu-tRNA(Gln) amidotransferase subunit GatE [Bacteroidales bacterium]MCF8387672.1 Glu-tRNA(Gln) amidotransferase subunit GatE [Bacteroidales bacterium]MCF8398279.1 Glu-tRNA(Gln) amidotransferase subunit GatE [Bacteroidales bacterium]
MAGNKGKKFDPKQHYEASRKEIGYVPRKKATQKDYDRIGFKSGLEVHQQLDTTEKLFCHCPAGIYNHSDDYDAELIRHMRPTLSELGEYDGTALMEFKTRKEIIYRIKNETACTYEVDDTPPFPLNKEALEISIEISLLSKLNIVGEVHVTRKQYLDGSIPTGFQRTGIIGVEGELQLKNKKIRLIQLSLEEDSCREISDVGHVRVYKTDRLGMPLIETVTYPDCVNPDEVKEACDYIRFLNRSTGKVRTGMGAGRQDVNVSCEGGSRVEIKGVAHTKWIPELTHVEAFRQYALLNIRKKLKEKIADPSAWKMHSEALKYHSYNFDYQPIKDAIKRGERIYAANLPGFKGILSHFTQPGKSFANEISDRLKVIACIEKPNSTNSEDLDPVVSKEDFRKIANLLDAGEDDAQIIFWGPEDDIKTALETIEERCHMAFEGVPNETRKSFEDGTTIFERVLPGADRMYPDTDTAPIPLAADYIEGLKKNLPEDVADRYRKMKDWQIPEDTYNYILSKNLFPLIEKAIKELKLDPKFAGTFFGHKLKFVEGHYDKAPEFEYKMVYGLLKYLTSNKIELNIAAKMLPEIYEHPKMDFNSVLTSIKYKKQDKKDVFSRIPFLKAKFDEIRKSDKKKDAIDWIMGELREIALGNISLQELNKEIANTI